LSGTHSGKKKMHQQSIFEILGYTIPEVKTQKEWVIQFSVKDKVTQRARRIRYKIVRLQRKNDLATACFLCEQLKAKLASGWIPERNERLFGKQVQNILITDALEWFMTSPNVKGLRPDSARTYKTAKNLFNQYLTETRKTNLFVKDFNKVMAADIMEFAWEKRTIGNRTYNNYLENFKRFFKSFEGKAYCDSNPFEKISFLQTTQKSREFIKEYDREKISQYISTRKEFRAIVLLAFWGLIRRTELTRIRILDIEMDKEIINLEGAKTKNKKYRHITLNEELVEAIKSLELHRYPKTHYVFSTGFKPGTKRLCATRISEAWQKMRREINIPTSIVFYSLRDSGIVKWIENDVPLHQIAEQAGHQDLKETSTYAIHAKKNPNEAIANAKWKF